VNGQPPVILASASFARRALLEAAGLSISAVAAAIDEDALKDAWRAEGKDAGEVALGLATAKAMEISLRHPEALVIGADQMLTCGADWFDKPVDRSAARMQLCRLSGRTHVLISAVAVVRNALVLWSEEDRASLTMRRFSEAFLDDYMDRAGDAVLASVGAYQLENLGAQLFERVEGSHFTILGLPLLPLLECLRRYEVIKR
jgi:septum formation protein